MVKLVIFDLDGTLVNSIWDLADATNKALTEYGFPVHGVDEYYYFVGDGMLKLIERALPESNRDEETLKSVHKRFTELYAECYLNKTTAYDGMPELVKKKKKRGIKTAVASNKNDDFTAKIIGKLFKKGSFDVTMGKREGVAAKPSPEIVFNILKKLEEKPEDAVMVGDTNIDVSTGKNAGLRSVGCLWGFREINELREAGADFIVSNPREILELIDGGKL